MTGEIFKVNQYSEREIETDRKRILRFRPKTKTKTKLISSSNNMRQSNVLFEYSNDAAQIQNYKNSRH